MKHYLLLFFLGYCSLGLWGQIDTNANTVEFEINDINTPSESGLEAPPRTIPSLTPPKDEKNPNSKYSIGEEEEEPISITTNDGLMENKYDKAPKAFQKDKQPIPKYAKDQFLGDIKTKANFVNVKYRDHEAVDGDLIRVFVNGDIVQSSVTLGGSFSGFTLSLEPGKNIIEFLALNQGSSGPNTAELHVYDDNGFIVSAKEWNLLTGRKATIVVIKE